MIKKLLATIFVFSSLSLYAQVPNGGFEDWSTDETTPNGWVTTNSLMALDNPQSVFKTTDAHSGNFACAIRTVKLINPPPGGIFVPQYYGSIFIGKQKFPQFTYGFPFNSKPTMLRFWYKYNARNNDSVRISITITKWNSTKKVQDTITSTLAFLFDSVGVYTKAEIMLNLRDSINTGDTAQMFISSSNLTSTNEGATLFIDDIEFAGGNVSINEIINQNEITFFPNPINNNWLQINFTNPEKNISIEITNNQGLTVFNKDLVNENSIELNPLNLAPGLYFVNIKTNRFTSIEKIIVQ